MNTRTPLIPLLALLTVGGLVACASGPATLNASDCSTTDWAALGQTHGATGEPVTRRDELYAQCQAAGVNADLGAYDAGYARGLTTFCEPKGGYEFGLTGRSYAFNCPRDKEPNFIYAYQIGYEEYELDLAVREADRALNGTDRDMRNLQNSIKQKEAQFYGSGNRSNSELSRVRADVARMQRQVLELSQERAVNRAALDQAKANLKKFRANRPSIPGVAPAPAEP